MTIAFGTLGAMVPLSSPLRFVLVAFAGWVNQQQRDVIDYLQEENRALSDAADGGMPSKILVLAPQVNCGC
jgi:hypothetical protein